MSDVTTGTYACPICGLATPHRHEQKRTVIEVTLALYEKWQNEVREDSCGPYNPVQEASLQEKQKLAAELHKTLYPFMSANA